MYAVRGARTSQEDGGDPEWGWHKFGFERRVPCVCDKSSEDLLGMGEIRNGVMGLGAAAQSVSLPGVRA